MKQYIKENNGLLQAFNPRIPVYQSYTWVSGTSPAGEVYIIKNDGLYYEDVRIVKDTSIDNNYSKVGEVIYFYGLTPPTGWLACDGSTYNVADYPELAVALGYSLSDATFNVPDFRQCSLKGANTTDGAGVITKAGIPSHTHTIKYNHTHNISITNHNHGNVIMTRDGNSNCGTGGDGYLKSGSGTWDQIARSSASNLGNFDTDYADATFVSGAVVPYDTPAGTVTRSYQCGVNILIRAIQI